MKAPKALWYEERGVRFPARGNPERDGWDQRYLERLTEAFGGKDLELRSVKVPVHKARPYNPVFRPDRRDMYLEMLQQGEQLPPLFVQRVPSDPDSFDIIDGSHRWAAAKQHGTKYLDAYEAVPVERQQPEPKEPGATAVPVQSTADLDPHRYLRGPDGKLPWHESLGKAERLPQRLPQRLRRAVEAVRSPGVLTQDLLSRDRQGNAASLPFAGHSYLAVEALHHLVNGAETGWQPHVVDHEGVRHWFLRHQATGATLDPTFDQFKESPPYSQGRPEALLTGDRPSRRGEEVIRRARRAMLQDSETSAPLQKMAIEALQPGHLVEDTGGRKMYDYDHLLTPEQRQAGYGLRLKHYPDVTPGIMESPSLTVDIRRNGALVGNVNGVLSKERNSVEPHSMLGKEHRGHGLARAGYEALYAHALHVLGIRQVKGMEHSGRAGNVHRSLRDRHGLDYQPAATPNPNYHGEYSYALARSEPELQKSGEFRQAAFRHHQTGQVFPTGAFHDIGALPGGLDDDFDLDQYEAGFLDPHGKFYNRAEAAQKVGINRPGDAGKLESEAYFHGDQDPTLATHRRHYERPELHKAASETNEEWLARHKVPRDGDRYVFYHATPKKNLLSYLRRGSLLETCPKSAAFYASRDRGLDPEKDVTVHKVLVKPHQILPGFFPSLVDDYPLDKALADIPQGKLLYQHPKTGSTLHDYSHCLPVPARSQYRLLVRTEPRGGKSITAHVEPLKNSDRYAPGLGALGMWTGNWVVDQGRVEVHPWETQVDEEHRGKGLGLALYEAALSHAKNTLGATHVVGDAHSTAASRVHQKLARKHGLGYRAVPNCGEKGVRNGLPFQRTREEWNDPDNIGDFDARYSPYQYMLKNDGLSKSQQTKFGNTMLRKLRERPPFQRPVWWHGTPNGDLRGGTSGLHVGTRTAAEQALHARIGVPVEGAWDGQREYGKTLLCGQKTLSARGIDLSGYNSEAPAEDHYPKAGAATFSDGTPVRPDHRPNILPLRITGKMTNLPWRPHEDFKANGMMRGALKRGAAKSGYYYENVGEDAGEVSAVVPGPNHIAVLPHDAVEYRESGNGHGEWWPKEIDGEGLQKMARLDTTVGYQFIHRIKESESGGKYSEVFVMHPDRRRYPYPLGVGGFSHTADGLLTPLSIEVDPEHRRKGIASAMYAYAEQQTGRKMLPSDDQTEDAQALWAANANDHQFGKSEGVPVAANPHQEHHLPGSLAAEGYRLHIAQAPGQQSAIVHRGGQRVGEVRSTAAGLLEDWGQLPRAGLRDAAVAVLLGHQQGQPLQDHWSHPGRPALAKALVGLGTPNGPAKLPQPPQAVEPEDLGPAHGSHITEPHQTYEAACQAKPKPPPGIQSPGKNQNIWVRQHHGQSNRNRTLMMQFSSDLLQGGRPPDKADAYYEKLYQNREGYHRPADFWEVPTWQAHLAASVPEADHYTVRNADEAAEFLKHAGYGNVALSALDVNQGMVSKLAQQVPEQKFAVGGPVDLKQFGGLPNVQQHPTIQNFVESQGRQYQPGYDYRHFSGTKTVPRLTLSDGCLHDCTFCSVPRELSEKSRDEVMQQVDSFAKHLGNSELVYLNDKTFGQAKNHTMLPEIYQRLKQQNPQFKGFVVQTTAAAMRKLSPEFMQQAGIRHVELGVESYNDPILKAHKKPANEHLLEDAANKLRSAGVNFIPNIMVGLPGETRETYQHTMDWLHRHRDIISHVNAYNLALYDDSELGEKLATQSQADRDENQTVKSWMQDPKIHQDFHQALFDFGHQQLDRVPYQDRQPGLMPSAVGGGDPNGGMVKSEDLEKMAIADLRPGTQDKFGLFDYSHLLSPEQRQNGYSLRVNEHSNHTKVETTLFHGRNIVGTHLAALESSNGIGGPPDVVRVGFSEINPQHAGRGLGQAMYEALYAHAYHRHGIRTARGGIHSSQASRVHEKLADKHGLDYDAPLNIGPEQVAAARTKEEWHDKPSAPFDDKFKHYQYTLKSEVDPNAPRAAAVMTESWDGRILFGRRRNDQKWCQPGGHLEPGENPAQAAARELYEEAGLVPQVLYALGAANGGPQGDIPIFMFRAVVRGEPTNDNDPDREFESFVWVDPRQGIPPEIANNLAHQPDVLLKYFGMIEDADSGNASQPVPALMEKAESLEKMAPQHPADSAPKHLRGMLRDAPDARVSSWDELPETHRQALRVYHQESPPDRGEQWLKQQRFGTATVPMSTLTASVMQNQDIRGAYPNFDAYHRWYRSQGDTPNHGKSVWPAILSPFDDETFQDGWHRFHSYYRKKLPAVPVLWYPNQKKGK